MKRSTCLKWGPASDQIPDLIAFRGQVKKCLNTARRRSAENIFYARMISYLEGDLIAVTHQIVTARQAGGHQRRKKAA